MAKERQVYVDAVRALGETAKRRIAAGERIEDVARDIARLRDEIKVASRDEGPAIARKIAEMRNQRKYGDPVGPSGSGDKSPADVVKSAGKTNSKMNKAFGVR